MPTPAPFVATSAAVFVNAYNLQTDTYGIATKAKYDEVDATTFASGGAQNLTAGVVKGSIDISGFFAGDLSAVALTPPGTGPANLVTVAPTGAANDFAVMMRSLDSDMMEGLKIGDMAKLDAHFASANNEGPLIGKLVMPATTATTTGTGVVQNNGAVLSTQSVYGFLHVYSIAGTAAPSIAVTLKSAALVGFGSPTTRLTFATKTAIGQDYQTATGPITDAYWRIDYTITGTTPSFGFAVGMAIQ